MLTPKRIHYMAIGIAMVGLILSLIAPGWALALIFAALIVYLWRTLPQSIESQPQEFTLPLHRRRNEPDSYRVLEWKGMIFRSKSEIRIAKTLDHRGIFFIPPTRVRLNAGKNDRQSRELDFVVCHEGKWGVLEVDGPYHVAKLDDQRDLWLRAHGVSNIQRFPSLRCYQEPQAVIDEFLHDLGES